MVERGIRPLIAAALLALGSLLGACADQQKLREDEMSEMFAWLPGKYDNSAQVAQESKQGGHPAHDAIAMRIMQVNAPRLGHHVFYIQESAANDAHRVLSARMFSFDYDEKNGIVGLDYEFDDPDRWRDAGLHPELFSGLVAEDTRSAGCEFLWKKKSDEVFIATHDMKRCHSTSGQTDLVVAELTPNSLMLSGFRFLRSKR